MGTIASCSPIPLPHLNAPGCTAFAPAGRPAACGLPAATALDEPELGETGRAAPTCCDAMVIWKRERGREGEREMLPLPLRVPFPLCDAMRWNRWQPSPCGVGRLKWEGTALIDWHHRFSPSLPHDRPDSRIACTILTLSVSDPCTLRRGRRPAMPSSSSSSSNRAPAAPPRRGRHAGASGTAPVAPGETSTRWHRVQEQ